MPNQTEHPSPPTPESRPTKRTPDKADPSVLVIFHGRSEIPLLRFLKPGFKHCFALVKCNHGIASDQAEAARKPTKANDTGTSDTGTNDTGAGNAWIVVDPLSHQTEVGYYAGFTAAELTERFEAYGCRVVPYELYQAPKRIPYFRLYTCVEVIKRILGILDVRIITPWQLYQRLTKIS